MTKPSQIVGEALSREDFLGRCTKESLLNKVVKMLAFNQQIEGSAASVSFYRKQLAGFFHNVEEKNSVLTSFIPKAKLLNLETY